LGAISELSSHLGTSELLGFDFKELLDLLICKQSLRFHGLCELTLEVHSGLQVLKETAVDLKRFGMLSHLSKEQVSQ
jgi:hypothetical protein